MISSPVFGQCPHCHISPCLDSSWNWVFVISPWDACTVSLPVVQVHHGYRFREPQGVFWNCGHHRAQVPEGSWALSYSLSSLSHKPKKLSARLELKARGLA